MGKKRSWFSLVKRLLIPRENSKEVKDNPKQHSFQKTKRWGWIFRRIKLKQCPAIEVPQISLSEASIEQSKHAVAIAIATAAAAEAAVTAANAAAEVVRLINSPIDFEKRKQKLAAIKIQTSFRAHLARKALIAMKGVVKLQAVIRGQNARRLFITCLKSLQSIAEPKVHQIILPRFNKDYINYFNPQRKNMSEINDNRMVRKISKNWEDSLISKEDMEISRLQRQEAIARRDRMKKYSFSHRERRTNLILEDTINRDRKRRPWFEECQIDKLKSAVHSDSVDMATYPTRQAKLSLGVKNVPLEVLDSSIALPRRSFCGTNKQEYSDANDNSLTSSTNFPSYMAATESAKAKVQSPRQQLGHQELFAIHSSCFSPKISSWSSVDGELADITTKTSTFQHRPLRTSSC